MKTAWLKPIVIGVVVSVVGALLWFPFEAIRDRMDRLEKLTTNHLEHVRQDINEIRRDIKELLKK